MHTGLKITAFAAALAASFGTAYGVGNAVDPVVSEDAGTSEHGGHAASTNSDGGGGRSGGTEAGGEREAQLPGGLQTSEDGYTLDLKTSRIEAGTPGKLSFAIVQESTGRNVTAYQREHEKELHLIVASRDLTVYRHLHPTRAADGTWSTPVELPAAGGYRVFADFTPKGVSEGLTLGSDLAVSGPYKPAELPKPSTVAKVDGYEVTLNGELRPGGGSELKLNVAKDGKPVKNLQPYLGAYGHLVALRSGDLAYLHVHPNGEPGDGKTDPGPEVSFTATAPSKGAYRLFLDFKHEGKVRTAAFTVHAAGGPAAAPTTEEPTTDEPTTGEPPADEHASDGGHGH
ncbi:DUF748 domain-containing protein [Streptomyces sp. HC44]|uniref:DUF748 domain-containing protein n=1 Tax=Streptomyces scabichelini TaxID=2711217 RepID=A0A6G4UXK0_9ACTN|nr:DUF748 domain-containing protein [Streptomyces scabichelini]NGO06324.1 DUF748 domain-containing protein [Streptomyces scabichelini]